MISSQVNRCSILNEFSGEQKNQYFGISRDKVLHHVDTLYYAVFINEPEDVVKLQSEDKLPANLLKFLEILRESKATVRGNPEDVVEFANGLQMAIKSFSIYEFCVSLPECFDIFISNYLPNEETPRVVVQLRSRYLVLSGVKKACEESFAYLRDLISPFGLFPVKVRENRIDYAFHMNHIQNPYTFFADEQLLLHLKSNLRIYQKVGNLGEDISINTLNLGNRKSNNVYFRAYNKCREVIEMNYKAFFIQRWRDEKLISAFDQYVYEVAYELKSYRTGCLVGRLKWYLEYGTNEELKEECRKLLESDFIKSDNCSHIEKKLHNVIPEPTLIFNVEYQTKRKFYTSCAEWLGLTDAFMEWGKDDKLVQQSPFVERDEYDPLLRDLYVILANARAVVDYLTGYGNVVSFVKDRRISRKDFIESGEPYMAWWKDLRKARIEYAMSSDLDLYRKYDMNASILKTGRMFQGQVARLSMLKNESLKDKSFVEDMADALCVLNDNDTCSPVIVFPDENGELRELCDPKDYYEIRTRKARQLRGILQKQKEEEARLGADTERKEK